MLGEGDQNSPSTSSFQGKQEVTLSVLPMHPLLALLLQIHRFISMFHWHCFCRSESPIILYHSCQVDITQTKNNVISSPCFCTKYIYICIINNVSHRLIILKDMKLSPCLLWKLRFHPLCSDLVMGDPRDHGHPVRGHLKEHGCHCEDALEATHDLVWVSSAYMYVYIYICINLYIFIYR